ncbi:MAG: phage tail tape measure protein, partial [Clostridiales bacterium]|nr:phage tail tape measure protein [Clostridiales bacterium]
AGIGTAALKAGNDFEAQMSRVSAIAGAYGKDLEKLRDQAIQLGAETSFSATEAAQAMENLASAGFGTQEIMAAMPGMLDLAASSGEDLASSADIAASTLRGFQLEASEAGHVADVLAKNAADTNAAIIDTGYAMKYVAPVAQSAGWSLEEVAAAIGVLADSGIKGEQAGTTLRSALVRMMKPTEKMEKAMTDLGITFYDAEGKMKPLSTIIDELQDRTKELTDEQRDNRIATIFGTEALSGMKVLLASSKEELDELTEGLENADGASRKMADTMLDNTKGSIEEMNGSLETAGITIQRHLAPWVTKGAKAVTNLANKFSELDEDTQGTILAIAGIAAATGPVVKIFGTLTSGVGTVTKGFGKLIDKLGSTSKIDKGAKALGGVSSVIGGIPTPAKLAVGAIAALGVGAFVAFR